MAFRLTDLPDDVLARIFLFLTGQTTPVLSLGSLSYARHAYSLAQCSQRLLCVFRSACLTGIDARPFGDEPISPYFPGIECRDPFHIAALVRIAGDCLREIYVPKYDETMEFSVWPVLEAVALHCPNLTTLSMVNMRQPRLCVVQILARVKRVRLVEPACNLLHMIATDAEMVDIKNVTIAGDEIVNMVKCCKKLHTLRISVLEVEDEEALLTDLTIAIAESHIQKVSYARESSAVRTRPIPGYIAQLGKTQSPLERMEVQAGRDTCVVLSYFLPLCDGNTEVVVAWDGSTVVQRGCAAMTTALALPVAQSTLPGALAHVEQVVVGDAESLDTICRASNSLRVVVVDRLHGRNAIKELERVVASLQHAKLAELTLPGDVLKRLPSRLVTALVRAVPHLETLFVRELEADEEIWSLVAQLPCLVRAIAETCKKIRVVYLESCLQVLDGAWTGQTEKRALMHEVLAAVEELFWRRGAEMGGLREGLARLVEEGDGAYSPMQDV